MTQQSGSLRDDVARAAFAAKLWLKDAALLRFGDYHWRNAAAACTIATARPASYGSLATEPAVRDWCHIQILPLHIGSLDP